MGEKIILKITNIASKVSILSYAHSLFYSRFEDEKPACELNQSSGGQRASEMQTASEWEGQRASEMQSASESEEQRASEMQSASESEGQQRASEAQTPSESEIQKWTGSLPDAEMAAGAAPGTSADQEERRKKLRRRRKRRLVTLLIMVGALWWLWVKSEGFDTWWPNWIFQYMGADWGWAAKLYEPFSQNTRRHHAYVVSSLYPPRTPPPSPPHPQLPPSQHLHNTFTTPSRPRHTLPCPSPSPPNLTQLPTLPHCWHVSIW